MLTKLYIKNYAIIEELEINFSDGLNIITGETGAGKSIIINALSLILGNRASKSVIRDGQKKCIIEAYFDLGKKDHQHYGAFFEANELDFDPETLIRREITANGKSRIFINDSPATLQVVKSLTNLLIDFNSQYQKFALLDSSYQLATLDKYAKNEDKLASFQQLFDEYCANQKKLKQTQNTFQNLSKEMDYIQFQLNELEEADLNSETEYEDLEQEQKKLSNFEILSGKYQDISQLSIELTEYFRQFQNNAQEISLFDESLIPINERIESLSIEFNDIKEELEKANNLEFIDPERQHFVEERLTLLHKLINKHQVKNVLDLLQIKEKLNADTGNKSELEKEIDRLNKLLESQHEELTNKALILREIREKTAKALEEEIKKNLSDVGIPKAQVKYQFVTNKELDINGLDGLDLIFSANPGFEAKSLRENASGGEISRFMLVVKNILAAKMKTETIILDEIDAGISGSAASMVADKLEQLSKKQQIICITHLAQVASKGKHHFYVEKGLIDGKTFTKIKLLNKKERVGVIAELLGVKTTGSKAIDNAKELLKI